MTVWFILRDVAFLFAAVLYALTVACWAVYIARFWQAARRGMAGRRANPGRNRDFDWLGALPAHVWMAAVAVGFWQVALCGLLVVAYDSTPQWWGLPMILAGDVAMIGSLAAAVRYEYRVLH